MNSAEQVLVVDQAQGALEGVMDELGALGFRVIWVPNLHAALEFIKGSPRLALVVASAAAVEDRGQEFLVQAKEIRPSLRIIWGARSSAPANGSRGARPDSLIPEPFRPDTLRNAVSSLLTEHFYPTLIADAVQAAALAVLGTLGEFQIDGGAFLVANQTELSDFSSIVAFSGQASGHLMTSMTADHVRVLHRKFLPGSRVVPIDLLEDLVGELCNRILGRINAFFAQNGLSVQATTPIFIRAAGSTMRYPGRHPSYAFQLSNGDVRVSLEYYLGDIDLSKLRAATLAAALNMGEILFL